MGLIFPLIFPPIYSISSEENACRAAGTRLAMYDEIEETAVLMNEKELGSGGAS